MSKKAHGGKPLHQWTTYFNVLNEKKNKSNKIAICKACSNTNDPFTSTENLTNKRSICRNHLKNCSNFKALYNDET